MSENNFSSQFWEKNYTEKNTGWDLGACSPPIKEWIDSQKDKSIYILIPGAGNAYEAAYFHQLGFTNVHVLDFARQPIERFKANYPDFPVKHIHCEDFFTHQGSYDFIVEQTFFCALNPEMRTDYVKKMSELLKPNGKLIGLLFNREFEGGPPFGGSSAEYETLFKQYFDLISIEPCLNSIPPRLGSEVFIVIQQVKQK